MWIRLFNILYRKHKSWMRQQGTPPTWDRDKVRIESDDVSPTSQNLVLQKKRGAAALSRGNLHRALGLFFFNLAAKSPLGAPSPPPLARKRRTKPVMVGLSSVRRIAAFGCKLFLDDTHVASPHMQHSAHASVSPGRSVCATPPSSFCRFFCRKARAPRGSGLFDAGRTANFVLGNPLATGVLLMWLSKGERDVARHRDCMHRFDEDPVGGWGRHQFCAAFQRSPMYAGLLVAVT